MNGTNLDGEMKQEEVIYLAGDVPTFSESFQFSALSIRFCNYFCLQLIDCKLKTRQNEKFEPSDKVSRGTFHQLQTPSSSALRRFVALPIS